MELSNFDKQVILFTKGHFSKNKNVTVEQIVSYEYDLNVESITEEKLLRVLVESLQRVTDIGLLRFSYREMFGDMFKNGMYSGGNGKTIDAKDIITFILERYSSIRVLNDDSSPIVELGEVNQKIINKTNNK